MCLLPVIINFIYNKQSKFRGSSNNKSINDDKHQVLNKYNRYIYPTKVLLPETIKKPTYRRQKKIKNIVNSNIPSHIRGATKAGATGEIGAPAINKQM